MRIYKRKKQIKQIIVHLMNLIQNKKISINQIYKK